MSGRASWTDYRRITRATWLPSHLGEQGNEQKLRKALQDGLLTMDDVAGNDEADRMAKDAFTGEEIPAHIVNKRRDRQTVTISHGQNLG